MLSFRTMFVTHVTIDQRTRLAAVNIRRRGSEPSITTSLEHQRPCSSDAAASSTGTTADDLTETLAARLTELALRLGTLPPATYRVRVWSS